MVQNGKDSLLLPKKMLRTAIFFLLSILQCSHSFRVESAEHKSLPGLWVGMMVKNEAQELPITLASLVPVSERLSGLFLMDTGSQDRTVTIARKWSRDQDLPFILLQSEFRGFDLSRNKMLDVARQYGIEYLLLMDAGDSVVLFPQKIILLGGADSYLCKKIWKDVSGASIAHPFRCVVRVASSFRYYGVVHEVLVRKRGDFMSSSDFQEVGITLFQDRNTTGASTAKRLQQDRDMLVKRLTKSPNDLHAMFSLARTSHALELTGVALDQYEAFIRVFEERCGAHDRTRNLQKKEWECLTFGDTYFRGLEAIASILVQEAMSSDDWSKSRAISESMRKAFRSTGCPEHGMLEALALKKGGSLADARRAQAEAEKSRCRHGVAASGINIAALRDEL